jgi:hypothetical protein
MRQHVHEGFIDRGSGPPVGGGGGEEGGQVGPFTTSLWILAGQSNCGIPGGSNVSGLSAPNAFYATPDGSILLSREQQCPLGYDSSSACTVIDATWGQLEPWTDGSMGPELSFGRALKARWPTTNHAIVKHATGGSGILADWDPAGVGTGIRMFDRMVTFVNARLAELPVGSGVAGFFWIQGEDDAGNEPKAAQYGARLTALIAAVRAAWGPIPVVINRLSILNPGAAKLTLRAQQDLVASTVTDVAIIDGDDLTMRDGDTHYDPDSLVTIGLRGAPAMPPILVPEADERQTISVSLLTSIGDSTDAFSYATPAITPTANRLVVIAINTSGPTGTNPSPPITVAGAGITFSQVRQFDWDVVSVPQNLSLWIGSTASPTTGAITITFNGGETTHFACAASVCELGVGADIASPVIQHTTGGPATGTAMTASLAAPPEHENNLIYCAFCSNTAGLSFTVGAGYTLVHSAAAGTPSCRVSCERGTNLQTATGTLSGSSDWAAIIAEFRSLPT